MPVLIALMFLLGIDINKKAFTDIVHNPKAVLLGLVPVACCPGGTSSNVFSMLAKGEVALSTTSALKQQPRSEWS